MIIQAITEDLVIDMLQNQRSDLLGLIRDSLLGPKHMRVVFESVRPEAGLLKHVARLAASHPDPEVREMAAVELLGFMPVTELNRYLWC